MAGVEAWPGETKEGPGGGGKEGHGTVMQVVHCTSLEHSNKSNHGWSVPPGEQAYFSGL